MTREEFLNIFVRKKNIARSIILSVIGLIVGVLSYCCLALRFFGPNWPWNLVYFICGWFMAEAVTVGYYFIFVYREERLKLDEELIRDIIE